MYLSGGVDRFMPVNWGVHFSFFWCASQCGCPRPWTPEILSQLSWGRAQVSVFWFIRITWGSFHDTLLPGPPPRTLTQIPWRDVAWEICVDVQKEGMRPNLCSKDGPWQMSFRDKIEILMWDHERWEICVQWDCLEIDDDHDDDGDDGDDDNWVSVSFVSVLLPWALSRGILCLTLIEFYAFVICGCSINVIRYLLS